MAEFTDTPLVTPRRRANPWLGRILAFATVVLLVDALFGEHGLAATMHARRQYAEAAATLAALRGENARLRERGRDLLANARVIEAEARRELGLARPGEILFVVRDR